MNARITVVAVALAVAASFALGTVVVGGTYLNPPSGNYTRGPVVNFNFSIANGTEVLLIATIYANFSGGALVANLSTAQPPVLGVNNITVPGLSDGVYRWFANVSFTGGVIAYNTSGNTTGSNHTLTVDSLPPIFTVLSPANTTNQSKGAVNSFNATFFANDSFSPTLNCRLWFGGAVVAANATAWNGTRTVLSADLSAYPPADYAWLLSCTDLAGNQVNTSTYQYTLYRVVVGAPVLLPPATTNTTSRVVSFNFSIASNGVALASAVLYANFSGGALVANESVAAVQGVNNITVVGIPDGVYRWYINVTYLGGDQRYNTSFNTTGANYTLTVDGTPPSITYVSPGPWFNTSTTFLNLTFRSNDSVSPTDNCTLVFNNTVFEAPYRNGSVLNASLTSVNVDLSNNPFYNLTGEGTYPYYILCADGLSNMNTPVDRLFTYDVAAPALTMVNLNMTGASLPGMPSGVTFTMPVGLRSAKPLVQNVTFNITVVDAGTGVMTVRLRNGTANNGNPGAWASATLAQGSVLNGKWAVTLNLTNVSEGFLNFTLNVTDYGGNSLVINLTGRGPDTSEYYYNPFAPSGIQFGEAEYYVDNWPTIQGRVFNIKTGEALNSSAAAQAVYNVTIVATRETFGNTSGVTYSRTFGVNDIGEFFIDFNDTAALNCPFVAGGTAGQQPAMYRFSVYVNGTNHNYTHASPFLNPEPVGCIAPPGRPMSGRNLFVTPVVTLKIAAQNATGQCSNFMGMVTDADSNVPITFFDNVSNSSPTCTATHWYSVTVPANRNYTVTVGNPPNNGGFSFPPRIVHLTTANVSDADTTDFNGVAFNLTVNTSFTPINVLGNFTVNRGTLCSPSSNFSNSDSQQWLASLNITALQILLSAGNSFYPQTSPFVNLGLAQVNATRYYNQTLPSGGSFLSVAYAQNGSNYYAGYAEIPDLASAQNNTLILYKLAGNYSAALDAQDVSTAKVRFQFIDENGTSIASAGGEINVETEVNYSGVLIRKQYRAQGSNYVDLPLLSCMPVKIRVFMPNYPPMQKTYTAAAIDAANGVVNVTMKRPEMRAPRQGGTEGSYLSNVTIEILENSAACNVPEPADSCFYSKKAGSAYSNFKKTGDDAKQFDSSKLVVGDKVSFYIRDATTGVTTIVTGVDMSSSSIPNMEFDTSPLENRTGAGNSLEVRRFGSFLPSNAFESIWVANPYNASAINESLAMNISFPYLYDDDGNLQWNSSVNTSDQIPSQYSDYAAWFNSTTLGNVTCADAYASTAKCYRNATNDLVWVRLPHFSTVGVSVIGVSQTASTGGSGNQDNNQQHSPTSWGPEGTVVTPTPTPTPTPAPTAQPTATPAPTATPVPTPAPAVTRAQAGTAIAQAQALLQQLLARLPQASSDKARSYLEIAQRLLAQGEYDRAQAYAQMAVQEVQGAGVSAGAQAAPAAKQTEAAGFDWTAIAVAVVALVGIAFYMAYFKKKEQDR